MDAQTAKQITDNHHNYRIGFELGQEAVANLPDELHVGHLEHPPTEDHWYAARKAKEANRSFGDNPSAGGVFAQGWRDGRDAAAGVATHETLRRAGVDFALFPEGAVGERTAVGAIRERACDEINAIETAPAIILTGYWVSDDGAGPDWEEADSGADAAQAWMDSGSWDAETKTWWHHCRTVRRAIYFDRDGDLADVDLDAEDHTVAVEPEEPDCTSNEGHDWQTPHDLLGGCRENPGVRGHGGGVTCKEVCVNCGAYRTTDSWAQDPVTGEQGLDSVAYFEADDASLEWIAEHAYQEADE